MVHLHTCTLEVNVGKEGVHIRLCVHVCLLLCLSVCSRLNVCVKMCTIHVQDTDVPCSGYL